MNDANMRVVPAVREAIAERAISWGAVFAGAAAAAALSLILLVLGVGLGLSSVSPWSSRGGSTTTLTAVSIIWLLVTSLAASGLGGYIAGRTRAKWEYADLHEGHFRDTVHGFLAWAVATILGAAVLSSAASSVVGAVAKTGAAVAAAGVAGATADDAPGASPPEPSATYFADMMLRGGKAPETVGGETGGPREVRTILAAATARGEMSPGDKAYLTQLVANRTGLTAVDSEQRVTQTVTAAKLASEAAIAKANEQAEIARKAAARAALWLFVSLLVGAFYASLAATWGGKKRDPDVYVRRVV